MIGVKQKIFIPLSELSPPNLSHGFKTDQAVLAVYKAGFTNILNLLKLVTAISSFLGEEGKFNEDPKSLEPVGNDDNMGILASRTCLTSWSGRPSTLWCAT